MARRILLTIMIALGLMGAQAATPVPGTFTILCYHEIRAVRDYPEPFAVNPTDLVRQFAWLRGNGYTPVSIDAIVAARQGGQPLPAKAVLLSFDDGYRSFYTRVFPLLRAFGFPAVLGVVGSWVDHRQEAPAMIGDSGIPSVASFVTWPQLREMTKSGLVEIASHTYDMHRGLLANPDGNLEPAATSRIYDMVTATYESEAAWQTRVRADLANNSKVIESETGRRPRTVVWPYGAYNDALIGIAKALGMTVALTLDDGANTPDVPLSTLRRTLIEHNPALIEFALEERGLLYPEPVRVVQLDLDDVYDNDPDRQQQKLSMLLDRLDILRPTQVYLRATSRQAGDIHTAEVYFPNRHVPVRADLFNRVAWQIASRLDVKVFALLPLTGYELSPNAVAEMFEDLAAYAYFEGLVFEQGIPVNREEEARQRTLSAQLALRVRTYRSPMPTVRLLPLPTVMEADANAGEQMQIFSNLLAEQDYLALSLAPGNGKADGAAATLDLFGHSIDDVVLRRKLVFVFKDTISPFIATVPAPSPADIKALVLAMRTLQLHGLINFGYQPRDFLGDDQGLSLIAPALSLRVFPLRSAKELR